MSKSFLQGAGMVSFSRLSPEKQREIAQTVSDRDNTFIDTVISNLFKVHQSSSKSYWFLFLFLSFVRVRVKPHQLRGAIFVYIFLRALGYSCSDLDAKAFTFKQGEIGELQSDDDRRGKTDYPSWKVRMWIITLVMLSDTDIREFIALIQPVLMPIHNLVGFVSDCWKEPMNLRVRKAPEPSGKMFLTVCNSVCNCQFSSANGVAESHLWQVVTAR